jgi:hypothetical protein
MKLSNIAPVLAVVALGLVSGCAAEADETAAADDSALSAGAGVEFTSAVGAVLVDGKKVCTAALVDLDASAKIGPVSAHGRQIVFGGACVGKLQNGVGAAVFVSQQNGLSVSTPIVAFDFESQASAGLAVGILGKEVPGAEPMDVVGTSALVNAGAHFASVIEADENGLLIASSAEIHAGVAFSLKTKCTSLQFAAQAGVAVGEKLSLSDDGLGASAFVKINGKLHFAAHIDAGCIVHHIGDGLHKIGDGVLKGANDVGNFLSSIGTGDVVAVVHAKSRYMTFGVRMTEDAKELKINGQGYIGATDGKGGKCEKVPLLIIGGPCELKSGYKKGELVTIQLDTGHNLFPNGDDGQRFVISTDD